MIGAAALLLACCPGLAGCGPSGDAAGGGSATTASEPALSPDRAGSETAAPDAGTCDRQEVPGHEGRDVRVTGLDCAAARAVILDAVGKGRMAYDSGGLSCSPTDAPDGRTDYACTGSGGQRLSFRYGAA